MSHNNKIIDKDPCFEVDSITRAIRNVSTTKTTVMQYDHNSERFSFTLPRFIEGHDMMESTKAEVHYLNVDTPGVYTIDDLAIDEADENKVKCTWLVSQNATLKVGALEFLLRFSCVAENGTVEYAWNTGIHKGIAVSKGMFNTEAILKQNPDALEQMEATIKNYVDEEIEEVKASAGGGVTEEDANFIKSLKYYGDGNVIPSDSNYFYMMETTGADECSISSGVRPSEIWEECFVIPYKMEHEGKTRVVSRIYEGGFGGANINKVVVPSSVKFIGGWAFSACPYLEEVHLCGKTITIEENAFMATDLFDIYYHGSERDWNVFVGGVDYIPQNATIHFMWT